MCKDVKGMEFVEDGWGCCHCTDRDGISIYNGIWRTHCKSCGKKRCEKNAHGAKSVNGGN